MKTRLTLLLKKEGKEEYRILVSPIPWPVSAFTAALMEMHKEGYSSIMTHAEVFEVEKVAGRYLLRQENEVES